MTNIEKASPGKIERDTKYPWDALAKLCKNDPGEFYRMPVSSRMFSTLIKRGEYKAFGDGTEWEATTRNVDGQHYIYVRYVPDRQG